MTRWFNSFCGSVTSKSLVVQLRTFPQQPEKCKEIEDILLTSNNYGKIQSFSVILNNRIEDRRRMFPRLYEAGIVVEKFFADDIVTEEPCSSANQEI